MNGRWIQNSRNGVARIEPRLAKVGAFDRFLFIAPVMFTSFAFFLVGAMPVQVLVGVTASCVIGDALIALKYLLRVQTRPPAKVSDLASLRYR
jgi:hypothetical protein